MNNFIDECLEEDSRNVLLSVSPKDSDIQLSNEDSDLQNDDTNDFDPIYHKGASYTCIFDDKPSSPLPRCAYQKVIKKQKDSPQKKSCSKQNSYCKWTNEEVKRMFEYICLNYDDFISKCKDKKRRFFIKRMADYIGTKNEKQCKSKEQKVNSKDNLKRKFDAYYNKWKAQKSSEIEEVTSPQTDNTSNGGNSTPSTNNVDDETAREFVACMRR